MNREDYLQKVCEHYAAALRKIELLSQPGTRQYQIARTALTTTPKEIVNDRPA